MQLKARIFSFTAVFIFFSISLLGQEQTITGEITTPYPTIRNIAIEWFIQGDTNQNGKVDVQFREAGKDTWKQAMPLRRVPDGWNNTSIGLERKIPGYAGFKWPNKHSGSIFNLKPNTSYEIRLVLTDPDGGNMEKIIKAQTRPVPTIASNAKMIKIAPGNYDTLHTVSGTKEKPVVYRCSKGKAVFKHVDARNKKWIFLEGLTIENKTDKGVGIDLSGSENCVVVNCLINAVYGIVGYRPGITNCYISDNEVRGIYEWKSELLGAGAETSGEGIEITGPGNVICFNKVSGFRDCISFMEDEHAVNQQCNDIYNNDISLALDDGVEADFCFSNCRIYDNRLTNCYVGLSSQPGLGGPTYFIRNVMYNIVHSGFKLKRHSVGDVVLHNTLVKIGVALGGNSAMDYAFFRNNLAIGGPAKGIMWGGYSSGNAYAADIIDPGKHSSFDYDAIGVYDTAYVAKIGEELFAAVEKNGVEKITMENTFKDVQFPVAPVPEYKSPDLTLKAASIAIDAGTVIPNINDGFTGKAPDCGAYEKGLAIPHYGPRK